MENGKKADLRTEMLGVGGDRLQGLCHRAKQNAVDDRSVLQGDRRHLLRQGEHDMEIFRGENVGTPVFQPPGAIERLAFRTMPVAAAAI